MNPELKHKRPTIEEFFREKLPNALKDGSSYPLLLIVLGEKPGALTMNVSDEQIEVLERSCEEFGLHLKVSEGRVSKPDSPTGVKPSFEQRGGFVARNPDRFHILQASEGRFYSFSDRAVGKFLGFPESAIEFFNSCEQPGLRSRRRIEELKEKGMFNDDTRYLNLTTYIPAPEKEAVEQAIETGKKRQEMLEKLDSELDTDIGRSYLERRFENSFY